MAKQQVNAFGFCRALVNLKDFVRLPNPTIDGIERLLACPSVDQFVEYNLALVPANNIKTKVLLDLEQYQNISKYKFNFISIYHYYTFDQKNFAEYEELTEGYNVINLKLGFKLSKKLNAVIGTDNLFNKEYSPHTSRIRNVAGGIPNPGRSFNINIKYDF